MSFTAKHAGEIAHVLGTPVVAAAMVVPPGATLYKMYAPKGAAIALGGPIFAAIAAKAQRPDEGIAGQVPREQGFLALTADALVYLSKKRLGVAPKDALVSWPRAGLSIEWSKGDKWPYPGVAVQFADGSSSLMFGDKRWGLDELAAAAR